ncbi:MAG TPA: FAD-dependent oxidoreductase [Ilumatobacter sp.]|nr:FAD-dependent oxidoreductase [Ilumatobacter sp.]
MTSSAHTVPDRWDQEVDFVVVGSGGGALTGAAVAALGGASVVVLEKTEFVGGTTAVSGGGFWIPLNRHMAEVGLDDSRDDALSYLRASSGGTGDDDILIALVDNGAPMVELLEDQIGLQFRPWPAQGGTIDYRPELPGARHGGRTLDAGKVALTSLGEWAPRLRLGPNSAWTMDKLVSYAERHHVAVPDANRPRRPAGQAVNEHVANGAALIAQLLRGCLAQGVTVHVDTPADHLVVDEGRVVGVKATRAGAPYAVRARYGVLMATGGFAHNDELKRLWLDRPIDYSCEILENRGDGHLMGMAIGAQMAGLGDAWWMMHGAGHNNRYSPHTMVVNKHGKRFCNDALNYYDFGVQFGTKRDSADGTPKNLPAWMVFDSQGTSKYQVLDDLVKAGRAQRAKPLPPSKTAAPLVLTEADTVAGLAEQLGIPADELQATVERFNGFARTGKDLDFGRGDSRWTTDGWGDPNHRPNPALGTVEQGPFFAIQIFPGALSTRGGLRVNGNSEVLSATDGEPIPGLYAAGNCSNGAAPLSYPGPGATIGASMTFGYLAARQVLAHRRQDLAAV